VSALPFVEALFMGQSWSSLSNESGDTTKASEWWFGRTQKKWGLLSSEFNLTQGCFSSIKKKLIFKKVSRT